MKERPIIFSGPMVRAILDGRKTQTRRPIKPQPDNGNGIGWYKTDGGHAHDFHYTDEEGDPTDSEIFCPYGGPGDRLWVRETWTSLMFPSNYKDSKVPKHFIHYRADDFHVGEKWKPSIHMPRWASRITLETTDVRVERVQEISKVAARAEGIHSYLMSPEFQGIPSHLPGGTIGAFRHLWDSTNGKKPGMDWASNPWVWVIEFKEAT
jgi:hypothetical protein